MSSAILYLAIVAIWACVLIPRWLRRDSARGAVAAEPAAPAEPGDADDVTDIGQDEGEAPRRARAVPQPLTVEESRRRMLAARRRLLLMLIGLEIAAIALAYLRLAAVWVVVPPSLMLTGYLLLLREAAQADAERVRYEAEARARAAQVPRATPVEGTSTEGIPDAAAALAARFAAAPVPADHEDAGPGRDFAPGLAGKYTTSNADVEDEDYYDAYQTRRAVGD